MDELERYKVFAEYVNHMCNKVLSRTDISAESVLLDLRDKYYEISPPSTADDTVKEMQWILNQ